MSVSAERVIAALWRAAGEPGQAVFAILDGARDRRIFAQVAGLGEAACCLYRGELDPDLAEAAPWLVRLEPEAPATRLLVEQGWGRSWGIFVVSAAPLDRLRRHFRTFLMVYDEAGKPLYFRWYDPRVLRVYLPTCTAAELATVFGEVVDAFLVESEDGGGLLSYRGAEGRLVTGTTGLAAGADAERVR